MAFFLIQNEVSFGASFKNNIKVN